MGLVLRLYRGYLGIMGNKTKTAIQGNPTPLILNMPKNIPKYHNGSI